MDEFDRRKSDPEFLTITSRMRQRLAADPVMYQVADTSLPAFAALFDREKEIMAEERQREAVREVLFSEPEPVAEEPAADYERLGLLEVAKESGGSPEAVADVLSHIEKEGASDE